MLTATIEQNGKKIRENILVIDSHSHLGQDIDGAEMMNPLAPGSGSFDFWSKVQGKLKAELEKHDEMTFSTNIGGKLTNISWSFETYPFFKELYDSLEKLGKQHAHLKEQTKYNSLIDQAVVFPFQDTFRDKNGEVLYRASNTNISRFATRFPFSTRLIGYCRVDPQEGEKAVNEVKQAREVLGLSGLKLHPRSEGWVDQVTSDLATKCMIEAAKHSMPIIFDTRGKKTIMDIGVLISNTRNTIKQNYPNLLPHFKVIIAHFAQGNVGDYEVYNTIVQPNTYGDLSMLHGEGAGNFFNDFRQWFEQNNKQNVDGRDWSQYLLFATDYPYFGAVHAQKLLIYIINKRFFDSGGTLTDTKNILGLNQLRLLPQYNVPYQNQNSKTLPSTMVSTLTNQQEKLSAYKLALHAIAEAIAGNKLDIKDFRFQFHESWETLSKDIMITAVKKRSKEELPLQIINLIDDQVSLVGSLNPDMAWNKFGYKYFNPEDRAFFSSLFDTCYLGTDKSSVCQGVNQILNS
ncbi:MAG: amidohydrolase family protein [Promethearchaeia archaeon]